MSKSAITIITSSGPIESYTSWERLRDNYPEINIDSLKNKWYASDRSKPLKFNGLQVFKGPNNTRLIPHKKAVNAKNS